MAKLDRNNALASTPAQRIILADADGFPSNCVRTEVWSTASLAWVRAQQSVLNAGTVNLGAAISVSTMPTVSIGVMPPVSIGSLNGQVAVLSMPSMNGLVGISTIPTVSIGVMPAISMGSINGQVSVVGTVPVSGTFWQSTQPVSFSTIPSVNGLVGIVGSVAVTGSFWQATQPVSGTVAVSSMPSTNGIVSVASIPSINGTVAVAGTVPVSGTFWQTTQPVSGPLTDAQLRATAVPVSVGAASVTFKGRSSTFRTAGRAGTAGQKILSLHNATGSAVVVTVNKVVIDLMQTVVKLITVAPPIVRLWKVTVLPTNGTALTKNKIGGTGASSASVTVLGDASADGTGSGTTLTATLPAGTILTQEFAPRFITAAGYEPADRMEFLGDTTVELQALEGVVLFLDYTLATQNPTTDMWVASIEWSEK